MNEPLSSCPIVLAELYQAIGNFDGGGGFGVGLGIFGGGLGGFAGGFDDFGAVEGI
jgi:hypothetical protein